MRDQRPSDILGGMNASHSIILGVDGGGTKTDACLAEIDSEGNETILGRGQAGSSNIKAVGADKGLANLSTAIEQAWTNASRPRELVCSAVLGLSGAGQPETRALVENWAQENSLATRVRVVHDALPVLVAGTPAGHGVALIAGTGAVAFAADAHGKTAVSGGWGYWFGDEGSGFWLGQSAARAVSQAADGRSSATTLTQTILNRLGIKEPRNLLTALSRENDVRSALAGLADLVIQCAEQGDATAQGIALSAAEQLATLVVSAAQKLQLGDKFHLALAGGVACGSTIIREGVLAKLNALRVFPMTVAIVASPVMGCLRLANRELTA